ncbi:universal stress protein [Stieleria varia]|uniref:Stress response protein NhaX n=1 Tax=Stieleria varia TaxID=2528005 RepID=A0A5C5ZK78_9BACT|nr:universal stress protein [Stieleria varia]TWT87782.1 Stress response protein NhaX [Stieleria varia]
MKVLFASDGSGDSMEAARFIQRLSRHNELDVHVLTVSYAADSVGRTAVQPWSAEWDLKETRRVEELHAELMMMLSQHCRTVVMKRRSGHTVKNILEEANEYQADLIVLGARGHSMLHRVLLGSVSDSVATHAHCSVAVVRPDRPQNLDSADSLTESTASASADGLRIMVGYDQSIGAREAVNELCGIQWGESSSVTLLSVASPPFPFEQDSFAVMEPSWETDEMERVRCGGERMASVVADSIPNTTTQVCRARHPGEAIVDAAQESGSDLVVVGETTHSLIGQWFLGGTSRHVLRHCPCSVWISRHHRQRQETAIDS